MQNRALLVFAILAAILAGSHCYDNLTIINNHDSYDVYSVVFRFRLQKKPFQLDIYQNITGELQFSTKDVPLKIGKWSGVGVSKLFHAGDGTRLGWLHKTQEVTSVSGYNQTSKESISFTLDTHSKSHKLKLTIEQVGEMRLQLGLKVIEGGSKLNRLLWGFNLLPKENLYGFGERYEKSQSKNSKNFYTSLEDFGFSKYGMFQKLEKLIPSSATLPFTISNKGRGILYNTTFRTNWEIDSKHQKVRVNVENIQVDLVLYLTRNPFDVIFYYKSETGQTLIPPLYSFGMWGDFENQCANASKQDWPYDQGVSCWREFINRDIPVSFARQNLQFLPDGQERGHEEFYKNVTKAYQELGLYLSAYVNPMISEKYTTLYQEAAKNGYFVKKSKKHDAVFKFRCKDTEKCKVSLIDFTNPRAVSFYQAQLQRILDMGFKGWLEDNGAQVESDWLFHGGQSGSEMHNLYPYYYHQSTLDFLTSKDPTPVYFGYAPDFLVMAKSAYHLSQHNVWGLSTGQSTADFDEQTGLPAQLSAMISSSMAGFTYAGSEIGGWIWDKPPTQELWLRWLQLGVVSPIMQIESGGYSLSDSKKSRVTDWVSGWKSLRYLAKFRMQLLHYTYTMANFDASEGLPIMRHHLFSFPNDEEALKQDYQFMFGDCFLAAPVVAESQKTQKVYLPGSNGWYDLTNTVRFDQEDGRFRIAKATLYPPKSGAGQYVTVNASLEQSLPPLFVKAGSIVPLVDPSVDVVQVPTNRSIISYYDRMQFIHYWVFPDKDGFAYGRTWDNAFPFCRFFENEVYIWNVTDSKNRFYTTQIMLPKLPQKTDYWFIFDNRNRYVQAAASLEEIHNITNPNKDEWRHWWDAENQILWLRYTGCPEEGSCTSSALISLR